MLISQEKLPIVDIFAGTRGPTNAPVMIVGEAWGESERAAGKPFVGASGKELSAMLREAGIKESDCFFTNLVNEKPNANDMTTMLLPNDKGSRGTYEIRPSVRLQAGLQRLDMQIDVVNPKLIIACGNWPLWYLTNRANIKTVKGYYTPTGIDSWRGSQLYLCQRPGRIMHNIPVLPIYHPAAILRMYGWRKITINDLGRAARFIDGQITWHDAKASSRWNMVMPKAAQVEDLIKGWTKDPSKPIICDLETKSSRIHIMGLTRNGDLNVSIPFFHITPEGFRPVYSPLDFRNIFHALYRLFTTPGMQFVGQNFAYDTQYIARYFHKTIECCHDTMIWQHVMFPSLRKSLDYMSSMYCDHHVYWKEDLKESTETYDTERACLYNCEDLYRTHEIYGVQDSCSDALGKRSQFIRRMELFEAVLPMMNDGVLVDRRLRDNQRVQLMHCALEISNWLKTVMPDHLLSGFEKSKSDWYSSPQQLSTILYDRLKLRAIVDKKTGARSTGKEALVELGERYPHYSGLFSAILLLRSVRVVAGNILSAPMENDDRMRTAYNMAGPITYRLSSSENVWGGGGNLQNIMRDREDMDLLEHDLI